MKIKDFAEVINGSTPSSKHEEYYGGDIVWITPKDLSDQNSKYIARGERNITEAGYNSCSTKIIPRNNLLLSSRAPIGLMSINSVDCCTNQGFKSFIIDRTKCDVEYLYYYFKYHISEIEALGSGTTFKEVSKESIENYDVSLPSICAQKQIATILSYLDSKIETNNHINSELESMAKTIYDYWFTQFDFPDENDKPYRSSGGEMVWCEELKRNIPKGWMVEDLSEYIKIIRGVAYDNDDISSQPQDGYVPLLKSNNIQNDKLLLDDIIYVKSEKVSFEQYLNKGSVFVTMSSGSTEHVGKTAIVFDDMPYCYGAFCSKITINPNYRCLISLFFMSEYFKRKIRTIVVGTSIKNINNNHLINNYIAMPPKTVLDRFEQIISPLFDRQGKIIKENQRLTALRDWLLPMLMNGQVGFKEANE